MKDTLAASWRDVRAVEGTGLENRREGSNPSFRATENHLICYESSGFCAFIFVLFLTLAKLEMLCLTIKSGKQDSLFWSEAEVLKN